MTVLSSHLPDLDAFEVLLAVARTGSLNGASVEVGVSQQAVSARIRSMEAQTGVVLVIRTARGSVLTPAGVVVAEWAARLLDVALEVDAGLASLRGARRSTLRVCASLTVAEQLLPGWLVTLNADRARAGQKPAEVVLSATNSETAGAEVRAGRAALGFVEGPTPPRGVRSRSVGHDRLVIVARPDHPWGRRTRPLTPVELAATALVAREEGSGTRNVLAAALRAVHLELTPPVLALSTTSAVRAAVLAGAGPAVLSELAVGDDVSAGRLIAVPVEGVDLRRTLRAIWIGGSTPPAGLARDLVALAVGRTR